MCSKRRYISLRVSPDPQRRNRRQLLMKLLVRADASVTAGTGHVMRCLALAQAWQDIGGRVVFAMAESTPAVRERLRSERVEVVEIRGIAGSPEDSAQTAQQAANNGASWVVVDGYQFKAEYQLALKRAGFRILFVDDNGHADHYFADLVLNQNAYATEDLYRSRESGTQLLLGLNYALLRREFRHWNHEGGTKQPRGGRILVTLGGSDAANLTLKVIQALEQVRPASVEGMIVAGGSSPHTRSLETAAAEAKVNLRLASNVKNMPKLMAWADIAVSAAGTTVLELAFMGVPSILLTVADNQVSNARVWEKLGMAENLGNAANLPTARLAAAVTALISDSERQMRMAHSARTLVDGLGADRVASRLA
jgi:UDP-2,4-diacetamido-2,4,6-trideoxy-beta-L-altropyranose hydrolase